MGVNKRGKKARGVRGDGAASAGIRSMMCRIRDFDVAADVTRVDELEKRCEAAAGGPRAADGTGLSLFTHLLGDPLCRVRNYPAYHMLVAEAHEYNPNSVAAHDVAAHNSSFNCYGRKPEIVGVVRAGLKEVQRTAFFDRSLMSANSADYYMKVACLSGLRVSHHYRRLGIGQQLVLEMEAWCRDQGAELVYIATQQENGASLSLFTRKLNYRIFKPASILVQPVYAKPMRQPPSSHVRIRKLAPQAAAALYQSVFASHHFFPHDIHALLSNPLTAGTWLAHYCTDSLDAPNDIPTTTSSLDLVACGRHPWAVLSLWKLNEIIKFEMQGASSKIKRYAALSRMIDKLIPWLTVPSLPNMFDGPFGVQLMYGMHAHHGKAICGDAGRQHDKANVGGEQDPLLLLESLSWHAHNLALKDGCQVLVAEMDASHPLKRSVPHWENLSGEDLWCVKPLVNHISCDMLPSADHRHQPHNFSSIWPRSFFDPRDF